jgi:hypothetical protein
MSAAGTSVCRLLNVTQDVERVSDRRRLGDFLAANEDTKGRRQGMVVGAAHAADGLQEISEILSTSKAREITSW